MSGTEAFPAKGAVSRQRTEPAFPSGQDSPPPGVRGELFPGLNGQARGDLEALSTLIERAFPVPARFRRTLPSDVAELSRLLTSARGERTLAYLNQPPLLSAYLRYFLPWNVYRLCRLLPGLDLPLAPGDTIIDLGSGPLSLPIALWLCRREFRALPLKFRCLDHSKAALEAGRKLFAALTSAAPGGDVPWAVQTIHGDLNQGAPRAGPRNTGDGNGAALVTALNLYNELIQPISPGDDEGQRRFVKNQAAILARLAAGRGRILVLEPGTPPSGRFITLLRESLIGLGCPPLSPCVHALACPFPAAKRGGVRGGKAPDGKWCHFAFDTEDAPGALRRLSAAAGIPKERATLSFLLAGPRQGGGSPGPEEDGGRAKNGQPFVTAEAVLRVISSPFPVGRGGHAWGRYACGEKGMALIQGEKHRIESPESGALVQAAFTGERDSKSGALVCRLSQAAGFSAPPDSSW
jgi:hypothetical protein